MTELRTIVGHSLTVYAGQMAVMLFSVADTVATGRYSPEALAALSVGVSVFVSVFIGLNGVVQAALPIWAEMHGAKRREDLGWSLRQSLYLCLVLSLIGIALLCFPGPILRATEVPEALQGDVRLYLAILALALPAALLFRVFAAFNQAIGQPHLVAWLQLAMVVVKVPLTFLFVFGGWGVPAIGVLGCALSTVIDNLAALAIAIWLLRRLPTYAPFRVWQRVEPPNFSALARFLRIGIPAGLAVLVEVTSFTLMALYLARLGNVPLSAHQIAANVTAVLYMVPLSLAIAGSARVGYWLGVGDSQRVREALRICFGLGVACALVLAITLVLGRHAIAGLYTSDATVALIAAQLLVVCALYHLSDMVQTLCVFLLRCWRITVAPLLIYATLLWGVGLGGGYWLAYVGAPFLPAWLSPMAFWVAAASALFIAALALASVLRRQVLKLPAVFPSAAKLRTT